MRTRDSDETADLSNKKLSEEAELVNKEPFEDILWQQLNDKEEGFLASASVGSQESGGDGEASACLLSSFTYLRLRC